MKRVLVFLWFCLCGFCLSANAETDTLFVKIKPWSDPLFINYIINPDDCHNIIYTSSIDSSVYILDLRPELDYLSVFNTRPLSKFRKQWHFHETESSRDSLEIGIPVSVFWRHNDLKGLTVKEILTKNIILILSYWQSGYLANKSLLFPFYRKYLTNIGYSLDGREYDIASPSYYDIYPYPSGEYNPWWNNGHHWDMGCYLREIGKYDFVVGYDTVFYQLEQLWFILRSNGDSFQILFGREGDYSAEIRDITEYPGIADSMDGFLSLLDYYANNKRFIYWELIREPCFQYLSVWSKDKIRQFYSFRNLASRDSLEPMASPLPKLDNKQQAFLDELIELVKQWLSE